MDRLGPISVGMTAAQVGKAVGPHVAEDFSPNNECFHLRRTGNLSGVSFMMIGGEVARIEVDTLSVVSWSGVRIGSTEEQIKKIYGARVKVEPHKYLEGNGHYLTLRLQDGRFGRRFETENRRVVRFYAGLWKHLRYVEGCA
ncbi:MAG: hypothetical protein IPK20_04920 [Betaproteobacteria bacterium]|nr:hypothetical protein [Betaproteobacteria bacterium]